MAERKSSDSGSGNRDIFSRVDQNLKKIQEKICGERKEPEAAKPAEGKVKCKMRCTFQSLGPIDTVNQEFWAKLYVTVRWRDNKLEGGATREDINWDECWDPRVHFVNVMKIDYEERSHMIIHDEEKNTTDVKLAIRMRASFKTLMDLAYFPFDFQKLSIELMSGWPINKGDGVEFENDCSFRDYVRPDAFTGVHEWELLEHVVANKVEDKPVGPEKKYSHYHISMFVVRKYTHFMWNIALVMFLFLLLGLASFAIPPDNAVGRFNVNVTLLLTVVAYKFTMNSKLPMIPYLTLLDGYVLSCIIIHVLIVIQNALELAIPRIVPRANANTIDNISLGILGCIIITLHVISAVIWIGEVMNYSVSVPHQTRKTKARMSEWREEYREMYAHLPNDQAQSAGATVYTVSDPLVLTTF